MSALIVLSPALIAPLPDTFDHLTPILVKKFPYKPAPIVRNNILRNPLVCFFASLLIVLPTAFINEPGSSRDLNIFTISSNSSFEIINVVLAYPKFISWIAASVADADAVNPNGIKTFLANGLSIFFIKSKPVLTNLLKFYVKILLTVQFYTMEVSTILF